MYFIFFILGVGCGLYIFNPLDNLNKKYKKEKNKECCHSFAEEKGMKDFERCINCGTWRYK